VPRNRKNAGIVSSKERSKRPAGTDAWWVRMRCLVEAGGVARLSLRPSRAAAIAARRRASGLPCVALFLANRSAPLAGSTPHGIHQAPIKKPALRISEAGLFSAWWRRGESNPRPKILYSGPLRAFPVIWVSSPGTLAGKVPFGPSREKARPSAPREEASGYPVRVTSSRLYGHSAVGGRRLKPPELTDSRWRLLVSRFLRGAGPRHATHEHRHPRRSRFAPLHQLL